MLFRAPTTAQKVCNGVGAPRLDFFILLPFFFCSRRDFENAHPYISPLFAMVKHIVEATLQGRNGAKAPFLVVDSGPSAVTQVMACLLPPVFANSIILSSSQRPSLSFFQSTQAMDR